MALNEFQKITLKGYAEGEYSYLIDDPEFDPRNFDFGDGLLTFLLIELSDQEDCEDAETAVARLDTVIEDVTYIATEISDEKASRV